jgi:cellulose synthase/poly-beta-1,6-N-acetylglucosamine synthase-like glycosyltransferase
MSISAGRSILDMANAIACLSGACSMYRRDTFLRQGGLDVGPGEDLEYSLRLRRLGYLIRFVPEAWAATDGPTGGISLLRQRARWDRDALRIRFMMYGELSFFHRFERLSDTLQRLDFVMFDLVPTLSLPFYLVYIWLLFGAADAALFLGAILFPAAVDIDFQHGACVRHVQSNDRLLRSRGVADLSPVPGRLSEMRPVFFVFLGNHLRHVAAR